MNKEISLSKINLNKEYIIVKIALDKDIKQRLYDLGLIENTIIKVVYKSPFNDPVAYLVRGAIIAIRNKDADNIIVRRKSWD